MIERRGTDSSRIVSCTLGSMKLNLTRKNRDFVHDERIIMLTRSEIIIAYCPHRSQAFSQNYFLSLYFIYLKLYYKIYSFSHFKIIQIIYLTYFTPV